MIEVATDAVKEETINMKKRLFGEGRGDKERGGARYM